MIMSYGVIRSGGCPRPQSLPFMLRRQSQHKTPNPAPSHVFDSYHTYTRTDPLCFPIVSHLLPDSPHLFHMSQSVMLFYSNRCSHCRQFLQELQDLSVSSSVHRISIDTTPRERIPSTVKSVPTLILAGQMQPLVGDQAFGWLHSQKQQQQAQMQQRMQQMHQQQSSAQTGGPPSGSANGGGGANGSGGEPSAWQCTEMGASFSDTYSFLDNSYTEMGTGAQSASNGNGGGSTIPKNFAYITPPEYNVKQPGTAHGAPSQQPRQSPPVTYSPPPSQQPHMMQQQHSPQQPQQQPQQPQQPRMSMPSGYGSFPPNATMAPPTQNGGGFGGGSGGSGGSGGRGTDELTQRMEALRMVRDQEAPPGMGRV